jgi:F-type H+-transporting ATPase subunit delta
LRGGKQHGSNARFRRRGAVSFCRKKLRGFNGLPAGIAGTGEAFDVSNSAHSSVAGRYANALFELADSAKSLDQVAQDLATFRRLLGESADLRRLVDSPVIGRDLQGKALLAVLDAAGIKGLTRSFIGTVAAKRRVRELPTMITEYLAELARRRGETTATVTSAVPLTPEQLQQLTDTLRKMLGDAMVSIDARVEPDILGGLLVKVGSRLFDSSIRSKLQRLQLAMKGVA